MGGEPPVTWSPLGGAGPGMDDGRIKLGFFGTLHERAGGLPITRSTATTSLNYRARLALVERAGSFHYIPSWRARLHATLVRCDDRYVWNLREPQDGSASRDGRKKDLVLFSSSRRIAWQVVDFHPAAPSSRPDLPGLYGAEPVPQEVIDALVPPRRFWRGASRRGGFSLLAAESGPPPWRARTSPGSADPAVSPARERWCSREACGAGLPAAPTRCVQRVDPTTRRGCRCLRVGSTNAVRGRSRRSPGGEYRYAWDPPVEPDTTTSAEITEGATAGAGPGT